MASLGAIGVKNQDSRGPLPTVAAYFYQGVPVYQLAVIIANYGQAGGGISIF